METMRGAWRGWWKTFGVSSPLAASGRPREWCPRCRFHWQCFLNRPAENGLIRSDRVFQAMLKFDRGEFMPRMLRQSAYFDRPQELGFRATISAPHMHAIALEQLLDCLQPGMTVLDIGAGSGYLSACRLPLVRRHWACARVPAFVPQLTP